MNYLTIAGHLGSDPETRFTANGQKVTVFRVATKGRKGDTIWWRVTVWGDQFDKMLPYLKKGSPLIAMGEMLKPEIFTGKDGSPQVSMQMVAANLSFSPFGTKKSEESSSSQSFQSKTEGQSSSYNIGGGESEYEQNSPSHDFSDEEIPF